MAENILMVAAFILFFLGIFPATEKFNLQSAGLACAALAFII